MPERLRTYAISVLVVGTPAGTMIGAALVPSLVPAAGWRGTFAVFGGASLLMALLVVLSVRESPPFLAGKGANECARRHARIVLGEDLELAPEPAPAAHTGPGEREIGLFHPANLRLNLGIAIGFIACTAVFFGLSNWSPLLLQQVGFADAQLAGANFALGLI